MKFSVTTSIVCPHQPFPLKYFKQVKVHDSLPFSPLPRNKEFIRSFIPLPRWWAVDKPSDLTIVFFGNVLNACVCPECVKPENTQFISTQSLFLNAPKPFFNTSLSTNMNDPVYKILLNTTLSTILFFSFPAVSNEKAMNKPGGFLSAGGEFHSSFIVSLHLLKQKNVLQCLVW